MRTRILYLIACLILTTYDTSALAADTNSTSGWSLEKVLSRALEQSPETKALQKDIDRAANLAKQAGRWENPETSLAYGPMTQGGLQGTSLDLSIRQSIPLFGQKSIAERIGEQHANTVDLESKKATLLLKHEVIRLALKLSALEEQSKHVEHRKDEIRQIVKFLDSRTFASPSQAVEKNLVLNRLREIEEKFLEISSSKAVAWQALNVFLNLESEILINPIWADHPKLPNRLDVLNVFKSQNFDVKRAESEITASSLEVDQAGKRAYPDIRIGAGYNRQTADISQKIYSGIFEFSIPIFDQGNYAKHAAIAEKDASTFRLDQTQRALSADFDQAWSILEQNKQRVEIYPLSLVSSLESQMNHAEKNWKKGLVPVVSFLELESQVHEQIFKVFDAQVSFFEAISRIQLLAGMDFNQGGTKL